jgi:hypothetical protein
MTIGPGQPAADLPRPTMGQPRGFQPTAKTPIWRALPVSYNGMTSPVAPKFDFEAFPTDTLFHERRSGVERREADAASAGGVFVPVSGPDRREKKERRRRVDPTTFDKQYTRDELDFMTAIQSFKDRTGSKFPTHREVIKVATFLGYRKVIED